jgi:phospholipid/cholesterol/gamma-HCH transport system substrate-binding protein
MEREAHYAFVGIITVALIIATMALVVWFAQSHNQSFDAYRIIFRGPISGLSKGGDVLLNGVKFGEITNIKLDEHDPNLIVTEIRLAHGTPVRTNSRARAAVRPLTGMRFIEISGGTADQPMLREISRDREPLIRAETARMDAILEDITNLTRHGADDLARLNRLLSDRNIGTISRAIDNVGSVTDDLRERRAMFAKLDHAAGELELATVAAHRSLDGQNGTLAQIDQSAKVLRQSLTGVQTLIQHLDGPVSDISSTTLPELNATLVSMQQASASLNELTSEISRDPRGTLLRAKSEDVKIEP